ncbi:MAG: hypothetical protein V1839_00735 [archaeon]
MGTNAGDRFLTAAMIAAFCAAIIMLTKMVYAPITAAGSVGVAGLGISGGLCQFPLLQDWNFISFCANPSNKSVTSVMAQASGSYDYVLRWNASAQAYELYSTYSETKPFSDIEVNRSYFVHMTSPVAGFAVSGASNPDINISLINKWNAPSWPYEFTTNVSKYLDTINGKWEYVLKWNASSQAYDLYSIYSGEKPFTQIFKGEGQYIFVNATSAALVYERSALQ